MVIRTEGVGKPARWAHETRGLGFRDFKARALDKLRVMGPSISSRRGLLKPGGPVLLVMCSMIGRIPLSSLYNKGRG